MKHYTPIITMILGIALGALAGHYHGKAEVYGDMFNQNALIAEKINER